MTKTKRSNNTVTIAFGSIQRYEKIIEDSTLLIEHVKIYIQSIDFELVHRIGCKDNNSLTGFCTYKRKRNENITIWRIQCTCCKKTWSVLPEFVLRYTGLKVFDARNCLYNCYYGASLEVNFNLFEVPAMQQYNYLCAIGRVELVKTLINSALSLPDYIICDEKHSKTEGGKSYLPTIVSGRVLWHLGYTEGLTELELTKNYGEFKENAQKELAKYSPKGILTDGFTSTQNSMKNNFTYAIIGICLLHACLLISRSLKKLLGEKAVILSKIFFNIFGKFDKNKLLPVFKVGQQIRRFKEKLSKTGSSKADDIIDWINRKKAGWIKVMQIDAMPKTTTLLDQAHNSIDRKLFNMKQFHHKKGRQSEFINGFAMLYNLIPYQKRAINAGLCGIEVNKGKLPEKDWMLNLQILTSCGYQRVRGSTT